MRFVLCEIFIEGYDVFRRAYYQKEPTKEERAKILTEKIEQIQEEVDLLLGATDG